MQTAATGPRLRGPEAHRFLGLMAGWCWERAEKEVGWAWFTWQTPGKGAAHSWGCCLGVWEKQRGLGEGLAEGVL